MLDTSPRHLGLVIITFVFKISSIYINPSHKILKLKAFADDKLNVAKMVISLFDGIENTVDKGENADYQHFLLFPPCFPKPFSLRSLKVGIVW